MSVDLIRIDIKLTCSTPSVFTKVTNKTLSMCMIQSSMLHISTAMPTSSLRMSKIYRASSKITRITGTQVILCFECQEILEIFSRATYRLKMRISIYDLTSTNRSVIKVTTSTGYTTINVQLLSRIYTFRSIFRCSNTWIQHTTEVFGTDGVK